MMQSDAAVLTGATIALRLAVAGACGLAVGLERQWSGHAAGADARFAGLRTFFLLGLLGGVAGHCAVVGLVPLAAVLLLGGAALVVAAYVAVTRRPATDVDGTTEAAALTVLALSALAGMGQLTIASGATALVVLALSEKARLHWIVGRIGASELRAALQFAVLALVVLPLLPEGPVPWLLNTRPRALWVIVLLFSALNYLGFIARRVVGNERGYGVAGTLGGLVSSTAVTFNFARQSRDEPPLGEALGIGVIGACTVLLPRVLLVSTILNASVARALLPMLLPALVVGAAFVVWVSVRREAPSDVAASDTRSSPLRLWSAIQMAVLFQLVMFAVEVVRDRWGATGLLATAAALGLTDVDALTVSMVRLGADPAHLETAARAIAVSVLANTLFKLLVALLVGSPSFRRVAAAGLSAFAVAIGVGLWLASL